MSESLRPVDGEFVHSPAERRRWCKANGHPLAFLNVSKSTKDVRHEQCICGKRKEQIPANAPAAPPKTSPEANDE